MRPLSSQWRGLLQYVVRNPTRTTSLYFAVWAIIASICQTIYWSFATFTPIGVSCIVVLGLVLVIRKAAQWAIFPGSFRWMRYSLEVDLAQNNARSIGEALMTLRGCMVEVLSYTTEAAFQSRLFRALALANDLRRLQRNSLAWCWTWRASAARIPLPLCWKFAAAIERTQFTLASLLNQLCSLQGRLEERMATAMDSLVPLRQQGSNGADATTIAVPLSFCYARSMESLRVAVALLPWVADTPTWDTAPLSSKLRSLAVSTQRFFLRLWRRRCRDIESLTAAAPHLGARCIPLAWPLTALGGPRTCLQWPLMSLVPTLMTKLRPFPFLFRHGLKPYAVLTVKSSS